ncbi:MAG: hypothetical protein AAFV53_02515 [Myxococcota bacterium]
MSLWNDLMNRLRKTGEAAKQEATRRATTAAAQATVDQVKQRISAAADSFLDSAEAELQDAQAAREGRPAYTPSESTSGADALIARAAELDAAHKARRPANINRAPSFTEQKAARKAKAQAELERLKQQLRGDGD